jgi:hypothetical protein
MAKTLGNTLKDYFYELPSKGFYLSWKDKLFDDGKIKLRPYLAGDFTGIVKRGKSNHEIFYTLLNKAIVDPDFKDINVNDLTLGDVYSILLASRIVSLGPTLPMKYQCGNCGKNQDYMIRLDELEVTTPEEIKDFSFDNNEFILSDEEIVRFRIQTLEDEKVVNKFLNRLAKKDDVTILDHQDARYAQTLVYASGMSKEEDSPCFDSLDLKMDYIRSMTLKDYNYVKKEMGKREPKVESSVIAECTKCGWEDDLAIPLDSLFRSD